MKTETYIIGPNDPPNLSHAKTSPVVVVRRGKDVIAGVEHQGWDLLDASSRKLNFVPDGTRWIK